MAEALTATSVNERHMTTALEAARRGLAAGEPPIGACIVSNGEIIASMNNAVIGELDITAHAEIRVIREACRRLRRLELAGCQLFVTVEPCPMCLSACHYAGIEEIVFGARLQDMQAITGDELMLTTAELIAEKGHGIQITGDCLRPACLDLLEQWRLDSNRA